MKYGNAIPQIGKIEGIAEYGRYRNVVEENARQSLKQLGREKFFGQVEYFFNHPQGDTWTCGWKVELP